MSKNRAEIAAIDELMNELDLRLEQLLMRTLPSPLADMKVTGARRQLRQAALELSGVLRPPVPGESDPLDLPLVPLVWGAVIPHDGGPRPEWITKQEWVGDRDYACSAELCIWPRLHSFRLRADHPYYRDGTRA